MKSNMIGTTERAVVNRKIILLDGAASYLLERQMACGNRVSYWFKPRDAELKMRQWLAAELWQARKQLQRMIEISKNGA